MVDVFKSPVFLFNPFGLTILDLLGMFFFVLNDSRLWKANPSFFTPKDRSKLGVEAWSELGALFLLRIWSLLRYSFPEILGLVMAEEDWPLSGFAFWVISLRVRLCGVLFIVGSLLLFCSVSI